MPGHVDAIECMLRIAVNPMDKFSGKKGEWAQLESDIKNGLTGHRFKGHTIIDASVFHMHASGVAIGMKVKALEKATGLKAVARRGGAARKGRKR